MLFEMGGFLNATFTCFLPDLSVGKFTFCVTRQRVRKLFHKITILRECKKDDYNKQAVVLSGCVILKVTSHHMLKVPGLKCNLIIQSDLLRLCKKFYAVNKV